jgi:hypothetical protein
VEAQQRAVTGHGDVEVAGGQRRTAQRSVSFPHRPGSLN